MDTPTIDIPEAFREDIRRAVQILKEAGCTEVFLFGSLARGDSRAGSDLDLAVRGCPAGDYFHILGELFYQLEHSVDLVDLDSEDHFARYLAEKGRLVRIG